MAGAIRIVEAPPTPDRPWFLSEVVGACAPVVVRGLVADWPAVRAARDGRLEEYLAAMKVFYDRHVCRVVPNPPEVLRSFAQIGEDPTVYFTMNGPSEFHVIGSLKHWSIIDKLDRIQVPTFLISGKYDEATPATVQPFADRIKDVRWQIFEHSSHMPHVEETPLYMKSVGAFLDQYD